MYAYQNCTYNSLQYMFIVVYYFYIYTCLYFMNFASNCDTYSQVGILGCESKCFERIIAPFGEYKSNFECLLILILYYSEWQSSWDPQVLCLIRRNRKNNGCPWHLEMLLQVPHKAITLLVEEGRTMRNAIRKCADRRSMFLSHVVFHGKFRKEQRNKLWNIAWL